MNASKENCQKAREQFELVFHDAANNDRVTDQQGLEDQKSFILKFLDAAERKLPRESSFPKKKEAEQRPDPSSRT